MTPFARYGGLAAAAILLTIAGGVWLAGRGPAPAFAQAAEKLGAARTLFFNSVLQSADGTIRGRNRNWYMEPGKHRVEMENQLETTGPKDTGFVVFDMPAGKVLMVSTTAKTAFVSPIKGGREADDIARSEIDWIRSLRQKVNQAQSIGEQQINGVAAKGYEIDEGIKKMKLWIDAQTGNPLRIELRQDDFPGGPVVSVSTDFKLDEPIDPKLFSLEPPEGYATKPFVAIDMTASPANYVAGLLKIYARHFDGAFPEELGGAGKSLAEKLPKPSPDEQLGEEYMQIPFYAAATRAIITTGKRGEDWQYYPAGNLGQIDRIVFWCRDKGQGGYSAVYGDLRVEKIDKERLPESGK